MTTIRTSDVVGLRPAVWRGAGLRKSMFTGVVFAPDGQTLYANIQEEGYTFAITGPFARLHRAA